MILDAVWIGAAFLAGLAARQIGLPPLVGYLVAGFGLFAVGIDPGEVIEHFADMGVTLLLFTLGLKLRLDTLLRPEVWGVAFLHMTAVTAAFALALPLLAVVGLPLLADLDLRTSLLVAFALSYSSTVFAVKVLEEKGEMSSIYGRTAIGILIMQDIAAVVFLVFSAGKIPSGWSLILIAGLVPLRLLLLWMMDRTGHAELLVLFGLSVALGGAQIFDFFNLKGDLGALIFGVLLARHRNANALAKALLGFKDLFLVGFFLSIGLKGLPGLDTLLVAALLVAIVPMKGGLFFWLLARFRLRSRTAFLASLALSNYSEFGLIVASVAAANGWIAQTWLTVLAVALALSFLAASPLNAAAHGLYERHQPRLLQFQDPRRSPDEEEIDTGDANVLVFGMGRVGTGAYDAIDRQEHTRVLGFEMAAEVVELHRKSGRKVLQASATDSDFWSRLRLDLGKLSLVLLAMPQRSENSFATEQLLKNGYTGRIAALVKYDDDAEHLKAAGVHRVFNLYTEAGAGFAADACRGLPPGPAAG
ncbi:MAG: cation:proton antiporter [Holophagales bacterium]|nr:cation:proton antiporter [Holophagales bacterium]